MTFRMRIAMTVLALFVAAVAVLLPQPARASGEDAGAGQAVNGVPEDATDENREKVVCGSKNFVESVLLSHMLAHLAYNGGATYDTKKFPGTQVVFEALKQGAVHAYVEYTGTLMQQIYAGEAVFSMSALARRLAEDGIAMSQPLGFNNTYVLAMREDRAAELGIRTISDLKAHPDLHFGFSNEFVNRGDGWPPLKAKYGLTHTNVQGMDHDNAYQAIEGGHIDVVDAYATDADIARLNLRLLADDLGHFPVYDAVILYRKALAPRAPVVVENFRKLEGLLDEATMTGLNRQAATSNQPSAVAAAFVRDTLAIQAEGRDETLGEILLRTTGQHLYLVGVSMLFALLIAVPLGVQAARSPKLGNAILGVTGVMQTIPSFALLVIMVPLMGTGAWPAIVALLLYSLLPIVRNTYTGLTSVPADLKESAAAIGLPPDARLWRVELPLAMRSILAGVKISVVINVGTATLGAFIGAGGYGEPILTGIQLKRTDLILAGAIPAAVLALLAQGIFELLERAIVSPGLRLKAAT